MGVRKIKERRKDISDYLIHWTNENNFFQILSTGYFKPSWAHRLTPNGNLPTIRGNPAVCLSEMPIAFFFQNSGESRYWQRNWFIAMPKTQIYQYGGRPVLYGDTDFLNSLRDEYLYLFCRFEPPTVDWTHEREWRVKSNPEINGGVWPEPLVDNRIPFHLNSEGRAPSKPLQKSEYLLIVPTKDDTERLREFISSLIVEKLRTVDDIRGYYFSYLHSLTNVRIYTLDEIANKKVTDIDELLSINISENLPGEIGEKWNQATVETRRRVARIVVHGARKNHPPIEYNQWHELSKPDKDKLNKSNLAKVFLENDVNNKPLTLNK